MNTLSQVPEKMQHILTTVANAAALETGFVSRDRKLTGDRFVQTLVFSWLDDPDATYTALAQTAGALGTPITRQAIEQRFTPEAAETLKQTLEAAAAAVVSADPQVLPLLEQFNGVYVQDSSWITLPDTLHETWEGGRKKDYPDKAGMKLHLRFDVATGTFEHFQLTDGVTSDSSIEKQIQMLPSGSLRLADLAYFSLETLDKLTEVNVFWITRLKVKCLLFDETDHPFHLHKTLKNHTANTFDTQLIIGKTKRIKARLVAQKISEQETQKRRRDIRYRAKRKNTSPSKERLLLAGWNIYITNISTARLTTEQIVAIARVRWQIELMFRCFKSIGKINTSRSNKPYRILCEVYAKLIVAIIRHWIMLGIGWRCLHHSLTKTAQLIATYARTLTICFKKSILALRQIFDEIKQAFQNECHIEKRADKDSTLKHLENAAGIH